MNLLTNVQKYFYDIKSAVINKHFLKNKSVIYSFIDNYIIFFNLFIEKQVLKAKILPKIHAS